MGKWALLFRWSDPLTVIYLWYCPLISMLTVHSYVFGIYWCWTHCDGVSFVSVKWKRIYEREEVSHFAENISFTWCFYNYKLQQSTSFHFSGSVLSHLCRPLTIPWLPIIHKFLHHHICPIVFVPMFLKPIDCWMLIFKDHYIFQTDNKYCLTFPVDLSILIFSCGSMHVYARTYVVLWLPPFTQVGNWTGIWFWESVKQKIYNKWKKKQQYTVVLLMHVWSSTKSSVFPLSQ